MLHLRTFGCLTLDDEAGSDWLARASQPKRSALLVYLAAARPFGPVERDRLLALFWPESSSRQGRGSLNQALHYLRRNSEEGVVVSVGNARVLLDEGVCDADVRRFSKAVANKDFEEAVRLHVGPFLDGFHISYAPLFTEWLEEERAYLTRLAVTAAQGAADSCIRRGDETGAAEYARKALEWAPFNDKVLCWTLQALDRSDDPSEALRLFDETEDRLRRELDLSPSPLAVAIINEIQDRENARLFQVGPPPNVGRDREEVLASGQPDRTGGDERDSQALVERADTGSLARRVRILAATAVVALGALWLISSRGVSNLDSNRVLLVTTDGLPEWLTGGVRGRLASDGHLQVAVPEGPDLLRGSESPETAVVEMARQARAGSAVLVSGESSETRVQVFEAETGSMKASVVRAGEPSEVIDGVAGVVVLFSDTAYARWAPAMSKAPGLTSLLAFTQGFETQRALDMDGARDAWRRALESHPEFYLAALELLGVESVPRRDSLAELIQSRYEDLSTVERLHFEAWMASGPARRPARLSRLQEAAVLVPERYGAWGARVALDLGRWEEALRLSTLVPPARSLADNPYFPLVAALHGLGRHEEELEVARQAELMHPEQRINQNFKVAALAALGQVEEIEEVLVDRSHWSSPDALDLGFGLRALAAGELWMHGYEAEASALARRGIELLESQRGTATESPSYAGAELYRWAGDYGAAEERYRLSLDAFPDWFSSARDAGVAAALDGDEALAEYWFQRVADWEFPPGQESFHTLAMARIRAAQDRPEDAARLVRLSLAHGLSPVRFRTAPELVVHREHPAFRSIFSQPVF